jgi:hypothetical protein
MDGRVETQYDETGSPEAFGEGAPAPDMPTHAEVLEEFNKRFKASKDHFSAWREEARQLYDLKAGKQWLAEDESALKEQNRPSVTFNLSDKYHDAIVGLQINNRQDIKYYPREAGDVVLNELLTGAVTWGRDLCDQADDETDAFGDCIWIGYGWMEGYLDRDLDPSGVPAGTRVDPLEMFPDPNARKRNLTDARYQIRVKFVEAAEYTDIVGDKEAQDSPDVAEMSAEEDDILSVVKDPQDYLEDTSHGAKKRGRRPVADYQFWRREPRHMVSVEGFGSTVMEPNEWKYYEPLLKRAKRPYKVTEIQQKVFYRARIAAGAVIECKRSPFQEGFTYHAITGKRDRNSGTFYGIGRALVDPQRWVNKFFSTILYALMTNAKGGIMAEEDAFPDPRKAEAEWANPSAITWVRKGALAAGKVLPKEQAKYPEGLDRLMTFSMNAIPQVSGLNAELLGLAERVQAGVVEAQRKQSAMAIIAWAFDAMRRYYRSMGRQQAEYVRLYMDEGTLIRVNGEAGKQYVPLVKDKMTGKYDVIVDEAPTSVNQRERTWAVLETLIPQILQAGMSIPKEVLDYAPLPADLAEKWKAALQPDPQKQQIDQQMVMATLQKLMGEVKKLEAGAQLDQAKAMEITAELGKPGTDPNAEMQMEMLKAQVEARVETRIAEFKTNREAETKLMIADMEIKSAERIAAMEAQIQTTLERNKQDSESRMERERMDHDARLEQQRMHNDSSTKMTVAAIAKGKTVEEEGEEKPDPVALVAEAVGELKEAIKAMSAEKPAKKRKFKVKRDKDGNLSEVEEG